MRLRREIGQGNCAAQRDGRTSLRHGAGAAALLCLSACTLDIAGVPVISADSADMGARHDAKADQKAAPDARADMSAFKDAKPAPDSLCLDVAPIDSKPADLWVPDATKPDSMAPDSQSGCLNTSTGTFYDVLYLGSPQVVGGYKFDYKGLDSSSKVLLDISCGASLLFKAKAFPPNQKTTLPMPADGLKIDVTPHTSASGWVDISIVVGIL